MRRALYAAFRAEQPILHIAATLDALPCPYASPPPRSPSASRLAEVTGLCRADGRVFSSTMVARGKPAPDLFLHAA